MSIDAVTKTTLIPGSVWVRQKKGEQIPVTVLFITNDSLPDHIQVKHPPQVVFLTSTYKVQSMDVEDFVSNRSYSTMDLSREEFLKALVSEDLDQDDEEDEDTEIDIEGIPLPDELAGTTFGTFPPLDENTNAVVADDSKSNELPSVLTLDPTHPLHDALTSHFVSYSEAQANNGEGDTLHLLRFALSRELTIESLRQVFGVGTGPLEISEFVINSDVEATHIEIDGFVEVFLEVINVGGRGQSIGLVNVTSRGDIRHSAQAHSELNIDTFQDVAALAQHQGAQTFDQQAQELATRIDINALVSEGSGSEAGTSVEAGSGFQMPVLEVKPA